MRHALDIRLRLHIDEAEIRPGETLRDTAERLLREVMTVDDKVLDVHEEVRRDSSPTNSGRRPDCQS
jgi:hypothetical protein